MNLPIALPSEAVEQPTWPKLRDVTGPGLITGASDDDPRHSNLVSGGRRAAPDRRPVRFHDLCARNHRHGFACGAGVGRDRGLGGRRGAEVESGIGSAARSRAGVLRYDRAGDVGRPILNFTPLDPIKALFWSGVINGVAAVPIMTIIMLMASGKQVMGQFVLRPVLKALGWLATVVMAVAAIGMLVTWGGLARVGTHRTWGET